MSEDNTATNTVLPLQGVRIVSVEQYGAGPWGTMLLADMGAEIIKVENPETDGDVARYVPPYTGDQDSLYFQSFNRNKSSITLNLRHPKGIEVFHGLVKVSDAAFNNLRGDIPAKLGLDYQALGLVKRSIVCCSLSAFGRTGVRASEPGYDYLMQGYAGWMGITGEPDGPPQKFGLSMVDLTGGAMAALGLLSAIIRARDSGVGCDVDVSLFDTALSQLAYLGAWHLTKGYQPERTPDSSHPSQIPSQVLPTKDGWMVVMCAKDKFYEDLVSLLGAPELAQDERFCSFAKRLENRDELVVILKRLTQLRPTSEWLELLRGKVPCAPVNSVEEAFLDPQAEEDGMILEIPHPQFGTVKEVAGPIKITGPAVQHRRGPALGEHTDEVLQGLLSMSPPEIDGLRCDGAL